MIKSLIFMLITSCAWSQSDMSLSISIPQNSGLFLITYENFEIKNDTLFKIRITPNISLNDTINGLKYEYDTLEFHKIDQTKLTELRKLLSNINELGSHSAKGCNIENGWLRFYISAKINGKEMKGFIANCYREPIFQLVDFMNTCYPKGSVINYDRNKVIEYEKSCNEFQLKKSYKE